MNILIYTFPIGSESREERLPPHIENDKEAFALEPHSDGTCTLWEWDYELEKWNIDWFSFSSVARATEWLRKYTRKDNVTWIHL